MKQKSPSRPESTPKTESVQGLSELLISLWRKLRLLRFFHRRTCDFLSRYLPLPGTTLKRIRRVLGYTALSRLIPIKATHKLRHILYALHRHLSRYDKIDVAMGAFFAWAIIGGFWSKVDLFGLSRASAAYSQVIVDRVTAPFYTSPGQDRIAVVLIDDATLESRGEGWPPPYDTYSAFLYRILKQRPKAVFVDIMLERLRERDRDSYERAHEALATLIPEYKIPVILGQSGPGAPNLFSDIPGVETAAITWSGHEYPLQITNGNESQPTAAASLYQHICNDEGVGSTACPEKLDLRDSLPMVPQWGMAISQTMEDRGLLPEDDDLLVDPWFFGRLFKSTELLIQSLLVGLDKNAVERVRGKWPYAVTVRAKDLNKPQVRGLLRDRAVLIGVDISGSTDTVVTPANGKLPGVYLHAMALDNLMRYGAHYYTDSQYGQIPSIFMAACIAILSAWMLSKWPERGILYLSTAFCLVLTVTATMYLALKWAPQNWVGYFMLASLVHRMQTKNWKVPNREGDL